MTIRHKKYEGPIAATRKEAAIKAAVASAASRVSWPSLTAALGDVLDEDRFGAAEVLDRVPGIGWQGARESAGLNSTLRSARAGTAPVP